MSRLYTVLLLILIIQTKGLGQQNSVDSLLLVLSKTTSDKARVDVLNQLSFLYYDYDLNKGLQYASEAYVIAASKKYEQGMRYAQTLKGYYYHDIGDYKTALNLYRDAAAIFKTEDDLMGYNYILTGNLYRARARYDSAELYYRDAIAILSKHNNTEFIAYAFKSLGRLYMIQWRNVKAEEYFKRAFTIYQQTKSQFGQAEIFYTLADLSKNRAQYQQAKQYVADGCALAGSLDDEYLQLGCLIHTGEIQLRLGKHVEALETLLKAVDFLNKNDAPSTLLRIYNDLGDVYEALGQNDVSLRYYLESLKIAERLGQVYEIANIKSNIAWIYKNQHNFKAAFDLVDESLKIRIDIQDDFGIANAYNTRGIIFFEKKRYADAIAWLNKSLAIRRRINHVEGTSVCLYNLALVYEAKKEFNKALSFYAENFELEKSTGNQYNLGVAANGVGSLYTQTNQFDSATYYLNYAASLGKESGSLPLLMNNAFYRSQLLEAKGDTKEALQWHKKYAQLNDSIYYENSAAKLAEMQALYQTDQKDKLIQLLNQDKLLQQNEIQLQKAKIDQQYVVIICVVLCLLLVLFIAFKAYQYNRKIKKAHLEIKEQQEELQAQSEELTEAYHIIDHVNKKLEAKVEDKTSALQRAYKELDTYLYRASHDFRRPLTTFLGLAEVANISVQDKNALELFGKVKETAYNLDKMLLKLQSISDMGSQPMEYGEVFMNKIFSDLIENYQADMNSHRIAIETSVDLKSEFYSYPALVYIMIQNIFENAIHFSSYEGGVIRLHAFAKAQQVVIEIEDNGEGIAPDIQEKIFEMYYRGSERSKGNGLGLYIVKKAAAKVECIIDLKSKPGQGSTFQLIIPQAAVPA